MIAEMLTTTALLIVAELGDKSQLVCLALATRYRPIWVLLGAGLAFSVLNGMAVVVGSTVGAAIPIVAVRWVAACVFTAFGLHAIWTAAEDDDEAVKHGASTIHPALASALMLGLAELGDKTQMTVAVLATVQSPAVTWLAATTALMLTSGMAIVVGSWLLPRLSRLWLMRSAGVLFLAVALWLAVSSGPVL